MRRAALLALLVAPLSLVACGRSSHVAQNWGPKLDPVSYVRLSAQRTARTASEHATLTGTATASGVGITMNGEGDFSNTRRQGSMHATFSAAGLSGSIDEVLDGTTIYMASPLFAGSLPHGKKWFKLDLQTFGEARGIDFSALMSQSPTQALQRLKAGGIVTKIGSESIDGVDTIHYRVQDIDISKLPQGAKVEALTHVKYGPADVWIGKADGYVRRLSISYSSSVSGRRTTTSMTMDFSRFGESVHATVPRASETFDATSAAIQGLGG